MKSRKIKKVRFFVTGVVVITLAVWVGSRWNVWFHNVDEEPYVALSVPHRVLLTFGDQDELSRHVSWQCDSVVPESGELHRLLQG